MNRIAAVPEKRSSLRFSLSFLTTACALAFALTQQVRAADTVAEEAVAPPSREAAHAAMEACLSENNLTPPARGEPPSEADRKVIGACMKAKGFSRPPGPPHHGPHHEPAAE